MQSFIQKYQKDVMGVLSGWDRVFIQGTQRALANLAGMMSYLSYVGVLLKDFGSFVEETSERIKTASEEAAQRLNRPVIYLKSCHVSKEDLVRKIALQEGISEGLICILRCVEPGISYRIYSNRQQKKLILKREPRQCLHYYHYWMDRDFGLMHARLQTWFPFDIQVCFNGRSWLARQMDKKSLGYEKRENCFAWLENVPATQKLMDRLLKLNWPRFLGGIARQINPLQKQILQGYRTDYYWSIHESEWATDIMFRSIRALDRIYPSLIRGAISAFSTRNVMRFLGKKPQGPYRTGEVISSYLRRPEGIRVKHSINRNSVKLYNKQGSVLRVETTINDPYEFKAFRPKENDPEGDWDWRYLRKGIADMHRRAEISHGVNGRYLEALSALDTETPLKQLLGPVCRRCLWKGQPVRALHPWSATDQELLSVISRGEYTINGFRNRDLVMALYPKSRGSTETRRQASGRVTRHLRLLRAHQIIRKVSGTHRYRLTQKGRQMVTAVLCYQSVSLQQLNKLSA